MITYPGNPRDRNRKHQEDTLMKTNIVRIGALALLTVAAILAASSQSKATDVKILLEGGKHAGQCVDLSSFGAHEAHGETWFETC